MGTPCDAASNVKMLLLWPYRAELNHRAWFMMDAIQLPIDRCFVFVKLTL
jgi:hypothetical protein